MATMIKRILLSALLPVSATCVDSQYMSYRLSGTDPACGRQDVSGVANACGIHIHVGTDCSDASTVGGHLWNHSVEAKDPWQDVRYSSKACHEMSCHDGVYQAISDDGPVHVMTGLANEKIIGHVVVVHDVTGARIACSPLGSDLKADHFRPYPGYKGSLAATGLVDFSVTLQKPKVDGRTGLVTDVWGIPNSGFPEMQGPGRPLCLTEGMKNPVFYQAGLATSACDVTGIPCKVTATGVTYIAYDAEAGALSAFVTFQRLNPFANGDFGSAEDFPGAQTPIIGMHIHQGNSTTNGPILVFFCGAPPLPSMHGLPSCSQRDNQVYRGYFMQEDGSFTPTASAAFKDYLRQNHVSQRNAQNFLYYNLHTTFSFAETQGNGLVRAQLVATGSPPTFALQGCVAAAPPSGRRPAHRCQAATLGSECYEDVVWAMSHGIQQHPEWYPGLSPASSFYDFQAFLHRTEGGHGKCPAPCSTAGAGPRRLRGAVLLV